MRLSIGLASAKTSSIFTQTLDISGKFHSYVRRCFACTASLSLGVLPYLTSVTKVPCSVRSRFQALTTLGTLLSNLSKHGSVAALQRIAGQQCVAMVSSHD